MCFNCLTLCLSLHLFFFYHLSPIFLCLKSKNILATRTLASSLSKFRLQSKPEWFSFGTKLRSLCGWDIIHFESAHAQFHIQLATAQRRTQYPNCRPIIYTATRNATCQTETHWNQNKTGSSGCDWWGSCLMATTANPFGSWIDGKQFKRAQRFTW